MDTQRALWVVQGGVEDGVVVAQEQKEPHDHHHHTQASRPDPLVAFGEEAHSDA